MDDTILIKDVPKKYWVPLQLAVATVLRRHTGGRDRYSGAYLNYEFLNYIIENFRRVSLYTVRSLQFYLSIQTQMRAMLKGWLAPGLRTGVFASAVAGIQEVPSTYGTP